MGKLRDKYSVITGGDSGIGAEVAREFADEGADVAIVYNCGDAKAQEVIYPLGVARPEDITPTYVLLASAGGDFYSGQLLVPNCGRIVGL